MPEVSGGDLSVSWAEMPQLILQGQEGVSKEFNKSFHTALAKDLKQKISCPLRPQLTVSVAAEMYYPLMPGMILKCIFISNLFYMHLYLPNAGTDLTCVYRS